MVADANPRVETLSVGSFPILARDAGSRARRASLMTAHGGVETPAFMPVGTYGAVKAMAPWELESLGAEMILGNAYHLAMRPGADQIAALGGLHAFASWQGAILTDSGGFQVFSLAGMRKVTDEGVLFRSHIDGAKRFFRPEDVVDVQEKLGVDVAMVLDECVAADASPEEVEQASDRTTQWARRSSDARTRADQLQFGIVQGALSREMRTRSASELAAIGFDGYAVGGLSVGESRDRSLEIGAFTVQQLPEDRPHYLMGVGTPEELVRYVAMGFDLFDCVLPTRNARNGMAFTSEGSVVIKNARYRDDSLPLDPACPCMTCSRFSRAYLRHLFVTGEMLAARLLTTHNLSFYLRLMARVRRAIESGNFAEQAANGGLGLAEPIFV